MTHIAFQLLLERYHSNIFRGLVNLSTERSLNGCENPFVD
jgi:hypothetical protein